MSDPGLMVTAIGAGSIFGSGVLHVLAVRRRLWTALVVLACIDVLFLGLTATAIADRERFLGWMQEDGWAEWATVFAFLAAATVHAVRLARGWRHEYAGWLDRLAVLGLASFCIAVAGEELSWGQRLFAFQPPEIFLAENFQQELNFHNFLKGEEIKGFDLDSRYLVATVALAYGLVVPLLAAATGRTRFGAWLRAHAPRWEVVPGFGLVAAAELWYPISLTGEAAELALGLLFLLAAAGREGAGARVRGAPVAALFLLPLALGMATPTLLEHTLYESDAERAARAEKELEDLAWELSQFGAARPRLLGMRSIHKRVFTAIRSGYVLVPASGEFLQGAPTPAVALNSKSARRDRRGYFLDPWNNPYWIYYRRGQRALLYSFGPNRRRDSSRDHGFERAGDDIVVEWTPVFREPGATR